VCAAGELSLVKRGEKEGGVVEIGKRGRMEVVGEMSFLMGSRPSVSVGVAQGYPRDVSVIEITHSRAVHLLNTDPKFAAKVLQMLAALLANRLMNTSCAATLSPDPAATLMPCADRHMPAAEPTDSGRGGVGSPLTLGARTCRRNLIKSTASLHLSQHIDTGLPSKAKESEGEPMPPTHFGLDKGTPMVAQTRCTVSIEQRTTRGGRSSVADASEVPAVLVIFNSHLCLEMAALNFSSQRVVAFEDVYGIEQDAASAKPLLVVACHGFTLFISVAADIIGDVSRELELARLAALDLSAITTTEEVGSLERQSKVMKIQSESTDDHAEILQDLYARNRISMVMDASTSATPSKEKERKETVAQVMGKLSLAEWGMLMGSADHFELAHRKVIIKEGESSRALYQLTRGSANVELHVQGRPQAVVVAHKVAGDIFGERSLLLGGLASASVVVSSETATVLRLTMSKLQHLFKTSHPALPGKLYYFLALDQARRLESVTADAAAKDVELVVETATGAPTSIKDMVSNPAFLCVLEKFISSSELARSHGPSVEYIMDYLEFEKTSDDQLPTLAMALYTKYLNQRSAGSRLLRCTSKRLRAQVESTAKAAVTFGAKEVPAEKLREIFAVVSKVAMKSVDTDILPRFLTSRHYSYVLGLKVKESQIQSADDFKAVRILADGQFGQVHRASHA
jgi:CRP-like cAMP-binding protein